MKKRMLSLALVLVLCLGLSVPAMAAEKTVEEVIPCELVSVGSFHEGLAWVYSNADGKDQYGFIDRAGEIAIPIAYDDVNNFSEGLAAVKQKNTWGFIDKTGKIVIPCKYDAVLNFSDGLAAVMLNGKCGFIDKQGKEVIPCKYSNAGNFSEGLAKIEVDGKSGFIDKAGKEVISCQYDAASNFSGGLVGVQQSDKYGYIDQTGKEIVPCKYDYADNFAEGLAMVRQNDKYGFIDQTGKEVIPCKYDGGQSFHEGLALVKQNNKWGYIDQTDKTVIDFKYDDAWEFSEGFAPVMQNGKWGYIDKTGHEVVPCKYDDADIISDSMARVGKKPSANIPPIYGYLAVSTVEEPAPDTSTSADVTAKISDWAKESVDSAAASGLIADGLGDDFTCNITRAQFAAVAVKLYEAMSGQTAPAAGDGIFTDTDDPAVIQAAALGFVGGVGDGKFDPDSPVTREQAATMLSRVYTKLGGEIPAVDATEFADDGDMSGYARSAIAFMSGREIVGGVGNNKFDPQGNASIEQALVIALRMFEKLK